MNTISYVKKKGGKKQKEWMELDVRLFSEIAKIIDRGKSDGSIRKDIDPKQIVFVMTFITQVSFDL